MLAGAIGTALLLQNGGAACAAGPSAGSGHGRATFYDLGGGMGNCSFPGTPADNLYVALGPSQYANAAACGSYLDVTGPKGTVRVKVIDQCPECEPGHLDLSRTAFKRIGNEIQGIIPISYATVTDPPTPGPLTARIKEGSSRYWFAVMLDNNANQLDSVQVASQGESFRSAHRTTFNYWIIDSGAGPGPFTIKTTDVYGTTQTLTGITLSPGQTQGGSGHSRGRAAAVPTSSAAPTKSASPSSSAGPSGAASSAAPTASLAVESPVAGPTVALAAADRKTC